MYPLMVEFKKPDGGTLYVNANLISTVGKNMGDVRGQTLIAAGGMALIVDHTVEEAVELIRNATCSGIALDGMQ